MKGRNSSKSLMLAMRVLHFISNLPSGILKQGDRKLFKYYKRGAARQIRLGNPGIYLFLDTLLNITQTYDQLGKHDRARKTSSLAQVSNENRRLSRRM